MSYMLEHFLSATVSFWDYFSQRHPIRIFIYMVCHPWPVIQYIVLLTPDLTELADNNFEGHQCFYGMFVYIFLLVAAFVGARKSIFPIKLATPRLVMS